MHFYKIIQVEFIGTGEEESYDAGAIKVEFFQLLFKEFNQRIMVGEENLRVPQRGDSINFKIFGTFLGHSLLQGGPGYYFFQKWVYQYITGCHDNDSLLNFISKSDIPLHAGSSDILNLLDALDAASSQEQLNKIVDENLQIINCSQWDPTCAITIKTKPFLIQELLLDELVRKRSHQIGGIVEGLKISGFYNYIIMYPSTCEDVFCKAPQEFTTTSFKNLFEEEKSREEITFVKIQSKTFFDGFISTCGSDILAKTFKFITGFNHLPPWGIDSKLKLVFLPNDEENIYPKALCCFGMLMNVPTVRSSQKVFNQHFLKALEIEGVGFSSGS